MVILLTTTRPRSHRQIVPPYLIMIETRRNLSPDQFRLKSKSNVNDRPAPTGLDKFTFLDPGPSFWTSVTLTTLISTASETTTSTSQTPSSTTLSHGYSGGDKIAIGCEIGIGLPAALVTVWKFIAGIMKNSEQKISSEIRNSLVQA